MRALAGVWNLGTLLVSDVNQRVAKATKQSNTLREGRSHLIRKTDRDFYQYQKEWEDR